MAEGLMRTLKGRDYEVFSAGTHPTRISIYAIEVMQEIGIDISGQKAKSLEGFAGILFDIVVTVCDAAKEKCPVSKALTGPEVKLTAKLVK